MTLSCCLGLGVEVAALTKNDAMLGCTPLAFFFAPDGVGDDFLFLVIVVGLFTGVVLFAWTFDFRIGGSGCEEPRSGADEADVGDEVSLAFPFPKKFDKRVCFPENSAL